MAIPVSTEWKKELESYKSMVSLEITLHKCSTSDQDKSRLRSLEALLQNILILRELPNELFEKIKHLFTYLFKNKGKNEKEIKPTKNTDSVVSNKKPAKCDISSPITKEKNRKNHNVDSAIRHKKLNKCQPKQAKKLPNKKICNKTIQKKKKLASIDKAQKILSVRPISLSTLNVDRRKHAATSLPRSLLTVKNPLTKEFGDSSSTILDVSSVEKTVPPSTLPVTSKNKSFTNKKCNVIQKCSLSNTSVVKSSLEEADVVLSPSKLPATAAYSQNNFESLEEESWVDTKCDQPIVDVTDENFPNTDTVKPEAAKNNSISVQSGDGYKTEDVFTQEEVLPFPQSSPEQSLATPDDDYSKYLDKMCICDDDTNSRCDNCYLMRFYLANKLSSSSESGYTQLEDAGKWELVKIYPNLSFYKCLVESKFDLSLDQPRDVSILSTHCDLETDTMSIASISTTSSCIFELDDVSFENIHELSDKNPDVEVSRQMAPILALLC